MIKLGLIVSEPALKKVLKPEDNFHLVLPHLFKDHPDYLAFYRNRSRAGDFVMCDNSVFELSHSLEPDRLIDDALLVEADEVVGPEVLLSKHGTLAKIFDFLDLMQRRDVLKQIGVAAAIQGTSITEFLDCYWEYARVDEIATICVPFDIDFDTPLSKGIKDITLRRVMGRIYLMDRIAHFNHDQGIHAPKPFHLLGLADGWELQVQKQHSFIRSNDSSSAFIHGLFLHKYTQQGLPVSKIPTKMDFKHWDVERDDQMQCIMHNIKMLKEFAGDTEKIEVTNIK